MLDTVVNFFLVHAAIVLPAAILLAVIVSPTVRKGVKALLRFAARILLLAAVIALAYDGTRTLAGGSGIVITALGDQWATLWPAGLEAARKLVTTRLHPSAWDMGLAPVLKAPTWAVLGLLGFLLSLLGRRRKEVPIFIN